LGKAGLSATHLNSLNELLTAHKLVKVDFNGARDDQQVQRQAADVERQLEGTGTLLQVIWC
jgi:RNA-binding protein YhbY